MKYPLAETFHSIKGEGQYTGIAMFFIRFAGCSVGRSVPEEGLVTPKVGPHLTEKTLAWRCHTHDGRPFWCDTDFHKYEERTEEELINEAWEKRIVLTGGEPLIHMDKLPPLLELGHSKGKRFHLETSGTIDWTVEGKFSRIPKLPFDFIAIAPKQGYIPHLLHRDFCDELKFLVDEHFDPDTLPQEALTHPRVYLQPVNPPYGVSRENIQRCMDLQRRFPDWILSPQLHKLLGVK